MPILPIDWNAHRKAVKEDLQRSREEWDAKKEQERTVNRGMDSADTDLVRFIVANFPARTFLGAKESEREKLVDLIAKSNGFVTYRTAPVLKQVLYRFRNDKTLVR